MTPSTRSYFVPTLFLALFAGCSAPVHPGADAGADAAVIAPSQCVVGGCSGQLCVSADIDPPVTTCEFRPEYACYNAANCDVQADGHCGWTLTPELMQCLEDAKNPGPTEPSPDPTVEAPEDPREPPLDPNTECVTSGCSGQLCIPADAEPVATTCEWREEYACYQAADCEKQENGTCGWTPTESLSECLNDASGPAQ